MRSSESRRYHAEALVIVARVTWAWVPTTDPDGRALAWPEGPEITAELLSASAFRTGHGGRAWVPPTGAVADAVLVLRGLALTGGWVGAS